MGTILIVGVRLRTIVLNPFLIHAAVLGMIVVPFTVLFLGTLTGVLGFLQRESTLTGRTELWAAIFQIPTNPVIGVGYESFWMGSRIESLWRIFWWRPTQAHNGYIETYVNLGWIGLGLLAMILLVGYQRALEAVHRGAVWAGLALACLVVAIPYNFTEASFRMQNLPWVFLLMAGMGVAQHRTELTADAAASRLGKSCREKRGGADGEANRPWYTSRRRPKWTRSLDSLTWH
jgi:O-antigen ligase